jgi:hypothetical protein
VALRERRGQFPFRCGSLNWLSGRWRDLSLRLGRRTSLSLHTLAKLGHVSVARELLLQGLDGAPRFFQKTLVEVEINLDPGLLVIEGRDFLFDDRSLGRGRQGFRLGRKFQLLGRDFGSRSTHRGRQVQ